MAGIIYTFDSNDMFHLKGEVFANACKTKLKDSELDWYQCEEPVTLALSETRCCIYEQRPAL